jgi:chromosome partitioning protein
VQDQYDFIIIDNAPDINISTINALVASDYVMVPIKIDKYSMDGMEELADQIKETKEDLNPELKFLGWFTTQFVNNPVNVQGEEILRKQHDFPYFDTHIRRTEKVDESTFSSLPINVYSKRCGAAKDYLDLVEEFLRKIANE